MNITKNQVAVITGAGSGIGQALALLCATKGMRVLVADIEMHAAEATVDSIYQTGGTATAVAVDVSQAASVEAMAQTCWHHYGACDLLCNNAGVSLNKAAHECTDADWDWVLGVNVKGTSNALKSFVPQMLQQDSEAHIVNTASMAGLIPLPQFAAYVASKYAVLGLSEVLAQELSGSNIGVSILCPGVVQTRIFDSERNRPAQHPASDTTVVKTNMDVEFDETYTRIISPEDVAIATLDAVQQQHAYIMTHPEWAPLFEARSTAIHASFQQTQKAQ